MGIDYSGGMIVGESGGKIDTPVAYDDDLHEWADDNGMTYMSTYYDAPEEDQYFGFAVVDVRVNEMDEGWTADVKAKAEKFEELTGIQAKLIGTQNIW